MELKQHKPKQTLIYLIKETCLYNLSSAWIEQDVHELEK